MIFFFQLKFPSVFVFVSFNFVFKLTIMYWTLDPPTPSGRSEFLPVWSQRLILNTYFYHITWEDKNFFTPHTHKKKKSIISNY